jgi:hypothetical protein
VWESKLIALVVWIVSKNTLFSSGTFLLSSVFFFSKESAEVVPHLNRGRLSAAVWYPGPMMTGGRRSARSEWLAIT